LTKNISGLAISGPKKVLAMPTSDIFTEKDTLKCHEKSFKIVDIVEE
jgi:hypothetical protein